MLIPLDSRLVYQVLSEPDSTEQRWVEAALVVFLGPFLGPRAKLNEGFSAFTSICANDKESSHTPTHDHIFKSLQTLHPSAFFVFQ